MNTIKKAALFCGSLVILLLLVQIIQADVVDPHNLPKPTIVPCGGTPCAVSGYQCFAGLACVPALNGQSYCSMPDRREACIASPSTQSCCGFVTTQPATSTTPQGNTTNPEPTTTPTPTTPQQKTQ